MLIGEKSLTDLRIESLEKEVISLQGEIRITNADPGCAQLFRR